MSFISLSRQCFVIFLLLIGVAGCTQNRIGENQPPQIQDTKIQEFLRKKAEAGEAQAQFAVGWTYLTQEDGHQDYQQAKYWLEKAALQGYVLAQNGLGLMYAEGKGVHQDFTQAKYWFEKAALQGNANAQFILGAMYAEGLGTSQDFAQSKAWFGKSKEGFSKACDNGDPDGCKRYRLLKKKGY